ncbi:ATP-binding protein [Streptomyces niveus]|jgi:anti-sigma regulatory factor (Ser/Thr protein kinase)|uniref:ATP-binding protein n=1 Tax=Streptomyces niveus TaxID=193462 RepID=UPI003711E04F
MHEYTSKMRVWGLTCPGFREEVGRARRWTRDVLAGHPRADDVTLIVSELGSNALLYTASGEENGTFQVALALSEHVIAVSVTDAGGSVTLPEVEHAEKEALRGRGLDIVSSLAHNVSIYGNGQGLTVTAELISHQPSSQPWR